MVDTLPLAVAAAPAPAALHALLPDLDIPQGYAGTSTDPQLVALYADVLPTHPLLLRQGSTAPADFTASAFEAYLSLAARLGDVLGESTLPQRAEHAWWDFRTILALDERPTNGYYLLRLLVHYAGDFEASVSSLQTIFKFEHVLLHGVLPEIDVLDRFFDIADQSIRDDGVVLTTPQVWVVAKIWGYPQLRELFLSKDLDIDYSVRLIGTGLDNLEDIRFYYDSIPAEVLDNLTEGMFD